MSPRNKSQDELIIKKENSLEEFLVKKNSGEKSTT